MRIASNKSNRLIRQQLSRFERRRSCDYKGGSVGQRCVLSGTGRTRARTMRTNAGGPIRYPEHKVTTIVQGEHLMPMTGDVMNLVRQARREGVNSEPR